MKSALFSSILILMAVPAVFSQAPASDWSAVESLRPRTNIIVETKNGGTAKGKVSSASPTAIVLTRNGSAVTFARDDVYRVYLTRKKSVLKRMFWGAAAGAGIGIGVGVVLALATKDPLAGAGGVLLGVPAGAVIGGLTTGRKRGELIYHSQ